MLCLPHYQVLRDLEHQVCRLQLVPVQVYYYWAQVNKLTYLAIPLTEDISHSPTQDKLGLILTRYTEKYKPYVISVCRLTIKYSGPHQLLWLPSC